MRSFRRILCVAALGVALLVATTAEPQNPPPS